MSDHAKRLRKHRDGILEFLQIDGDKPITTQTHYFALGYLKGLEHEFMRIKKPDQLQQDKLALYELMSDFLIQDANHYTSLNQKESELLKGYYIHK